MNMKTRLQRLRKNEAIRSLVRETRITPSDFVMPYFVRHGKNIRQPIPSLPGQFQFSTDELAKEIKSLRNTGISSIMIFGIPSKKDARGSGAWEKDGIVQTAVRNIKEADSEITVITDVCLCQYTDHGHCGLMSHNGKIDNTATLPLLAQTAISQVQAGADIVAPSGMMDGAVAALREALEETPILSYAAKYASSFYGPFREAADSSPEFGDRSTYQMDPANSTEALREMDLDLKEGADIIMVKPALAYLDVVRRAKEKFACPLAAYQVSGEYAMIKAAGERGWIDEKKVTLEVLTSIKRAGADFMVTYFARTASKWLS